jgi:hypothetical protein
LQPNRPKISPSSETTSSNPIDDLIAAVQKPHASRNPPEISIQSDRDLRQKIAEINYCIKKNKFANFPPEYASWFLNSQNSTVGQYRDWIEQVYVSWGVFDIYWKGLKKNR